MMIMSSAKCPDGIGPGYQPVAVKLLQSDFEFLNQRFLASVDGGARDHVRRCGLLIGVDQDVHVEEANISILQIGAGSGGDLNQLFAPVDRSTVQSDRIVTDDGAF